MKLTTSEASVPASSALMPSRAVSPATRPSRMDSKTTAPVRTDCGAGLNTTGAPEASPASTPPVGMATGKFHGGMTSTSLDGWNWAPGTSSSPRASRP